VTEAPALRLSPPPGFLSDPALMAVLDALPRARIVGGAVRDSLVGRPVADIDLATPDRPETVMQALTHAGLRAAPTGLAHGTVTAISDHRGFEITTLRVDVETDGRHALVAFTDDWRADAARRDFTFNALSMTRDGAVFDPFGGIADLRAGITRFVGDPASRIAEDYLRILRFFRFHARYGARPPDAATAAAIRGGLDGLTRLSVERIWHELRRILLAEDPRSAVRLMATLGVLAAVIPEGACPAALERVVAAGAPADPLLRLAALLRGDAIAFATRLRLSGAERDRLVALRAAAPPRLDSDDATLRRHLAEAPAAMLIDRCWLADDGARGWAELRRRLGAMVRPVFPLVGRDMVALGVPPGPAVGRLLAATRAWWLAGGCLADRDACLAHAAELHQAAPLAGAPDGDRTGGLGGATARRWEPC
jgi:poly(A) polymerase/tRNA nucleotidyltransferase (CCA-adding enzyme)